MRIAIVSDLHAFDSSSWEGDSQPSYYDANISADRTQCPVEGLKQLIANENLCADLLLCPGDLVDRACRNSLPTVWNEVNGLSSMLGASHVFATAGNHDVDSRYIHSSYDPVEALKDLAPGFPVSDRTLKNQYWSEHFFVFEYDFLRLLVVNSSAYHTNADEVQHGRISSSTLQRIANELKPSRQDTLNVLLCHHNPHKHSELKLGELDEIKGGQLLLDLLQTPTQLGWLVIHGHKHHPKLTYAAGNSGSPIVFSAGSLASTLYPELRGETGNQFYIVDVDASNFATRGLVGTFKSWDWHGGFGWRVADSKKGLPARGGFGHRENPLVLANRMKSKLQSLSDKHLKGERIYKKFPELAFVTPNDLDALVVALESIGVMCEFSDVKLMTELCIV